METQIVQSEMTRRYVVRVLFSFFSLDDQMMERVQLIRVNEHFNQTDFDRSRSFSQM